MGTTADKLQYLIDAKSAISAAIEAKGGTVPTELSGYGPAIEALPSGGGSDLAIKIIGRSVTEVTAADLSGATSIGTNAFANCSSLSSITIPDSVTHIGEYAFYWCTKLTSITIPNSVTSIGGYTFRNCSSMTSITVGNKVTSIGTYAFAYCSNCLIYDFSNHTSVPALASTSAFSSTNANKKIIVPDALYDSWKAANNWKSTTNGIVGAITKASEA